MSSHSPTLRNAPPQLRAAVKAVQGQFQDVLPYIGEINDDDAAEGAFIQEQKGDDVGKVVIGKKIGKGVPFSHLKALLVHELTHARQYLGAKEHQENPPPGPSPRQVGKYFNFPREVEARAAEILSHRPLLGQQQAMEIANSPEQYNDFYRSLKYPTKHLIPEGKIKTILDFKEKHMAAKKDRGVHWGNRPGVHWGSKPGVHWGSKPGVHWGSKPGVHWGSLESNPAVRGLKDVDSGVHWGSRPGVHWGSRPGVHWGNKKGR